MGKEKLDPNPEIAQYNEPGEEINHFSHFARNY